MKRSPAQTSTDSPRGSQFPSPQGQGQHAQFAPMPLADFAPPTQLALTQFPSTSMQGSATTIAADHATTQDALSQLISTSMPSSATTTAADLVFTRPAATSPATEVPDETESPAAGHTHRYRHRHRHRHTHTSRMRLKQQRIYYATVGMG